MELPVLERLKFLAIIASNLDEFFYGQSEGIGNAARRGEEKTEPCRHY